MINQRTLCPAQVPACPSRAARLTALCAMALAMLALGAWPSLAQPWESKSALEMARGSDAVLVGRAAEVAPETARVEVLEVLKGAPLPAQIQVAPAKRMIDVGPTPTFEAGHESLLFLSRGQGQAWTVGGRGWHSIALRQNSRAATIEGVKSLIELLRSGPEEEATDRAMLKWATSPNPFLRAQSHLYIAMEMGGPKRHALYKTELLQMLAQPGSDV